MKPLLSHNKRNRRRNKATIWYPSTPMNDLSQQEGTSKRAGSLSQNAPNWLVTIADEVT
jgi:hypothetical protein